jgi:hypothetical protein
MLALARTALSNVLQAGAVVGWYSGGIGAITSLVDRIQLSSRTYP